MKAEMTALEIAEILGRTKSTILRRAEKEGWPYQNGKNRAKRFLTESLPPEIKAQVMQAQASVYQKGIILPARGDLDMSQAKALLDMFDRAAPWSRRKAEARGDIVDAFDRYSKGKKLTVAKQEFVNRYNVHNPNLGIEPHVFETYSRISRPSLDLWRSRKKKMGLAGLLESEKRGKPSSALSVEMQQYIIGLIKQKPHRRPVRIIDYINNRFSGGDQPLPSDATIRRFITNWKKENKDLVTFLENPDTWRSTYQPALGDASVKAKYFLHMLEFDNTPADLLCADGKRYTLTGAIDIYSRKAMCMVVPTAKSVSVSNLMRRIILEWGLFDVMIADNGKDYASRHIEACCGALNIEMPPLPPFTPEAKPHIERFFRTISMMLFEELDGYIGHSVADRKNIESQRSFAQRMFDKDSVIECRMMPDELQKVIDTWIDTIYHRREHRNLGKPPEAKAGESQHPERKILDERVLDILLAPVGKPTVQKKGIRFNNGHYAAIELANHIGKKVEIRQDLSDAGKLYVFDLEAHYICIAKDNSLEGISVEDATRARKRQVRDIKERARALKTLAESAGDPMAELIAAKQEEPSKTFAFNRQEAFENKSVAEAARAVADPEPEGTFKPDLEEIETPPEDTGKVVQLCEEPLFVEAVDKFRYLEQQEKIRKLTEREIGWREGYMATQEYHDIFVAPYK